MNPTRIEWTDYTWNPITGCGKKPHCPYCYAKKITQRFPNNYPAGFNPYFYPERLSEPYKLKKPSKIFTGSMGDLFGVGVDASWLSKIKQVIFDNQQHQFQILTKDPWGIKSKWPENVWLGATVEEDIYSFRAEIIKRVRTNGIKFVSIEPLTAPVTFELGGLDWVIIGMETGNRKNKIVPEPEWVEETIKNADKEGIPVFVKNNLLKILPDELKRQEFPGVVA